MCERCLDLVDAILGDVRGRRRRDQLFKRLFPLTHATITEIEVPVEYPVAYGVRIRSYVGGPGPLRGVAR